MTRDRRLALGVSFAILALPAIVAARDAVTFYAANRSNGFFESGGQAREYLLYVPPTYDPGKPTPLVISLHGAVLWGAAQKEISQWNRVADREGFIVVYPSGAKGSGPRAWHEGSSTLPSPDERFIAELIDTLRSHYNIDTTRIFANGLSKQLRNDP